MDLFEGFKMLVEKKNSVLPILSEYDFSSALSVVFAITSWRSNRGAQESCLALNSAIIDIREWGRKSIATPNDLSKLFSRLYPILQITPYDDPVLPDFGEIKLNFKNRYYSVITGTGHTASVFSAYQFLHVISNITCMEKETLQILEYSDYFLNLLRNNNAPIDRDFSLMSQLEMPSFDYYTEAKNYIDGKKWLGLDISILKMLDAKENDIVRSHFFVYDGVWYPLFNPSLLIDYQIKILQKCSQKDLHQGIFIALAEKLALVYASDKIPADHVFKECLLLADRTPLLNKPAFASWVDGGIVVFLFCENKRQTEHEMKVLQAAHDNNKLNIVDLRKRISSSSYYAYHIERECKLSVIYYDDYINVDKTRMSLGSSDEKRVYTALDLMYMIMYSTDLCQIIEFDSNNTNKATRVFSWGGLSDYYTAFINENGYISKGALEYNSIYSEIDTAASQILLYYLELQEIFPFHLPSTSFASPECWCISHDENGVNHFSRKAKALPCGSLFKYDNDFVVFLSYDFISIIKNSNAAQVNLSLDLFRCIAEKFFVEYRQELSTNAFLANSFVQYICRSFSLDDTDHYIRCSNVCTSSNVLTIDCEVNCNLIVTDIAKAEDRTVECSFMSELLSPLLQHYESDFSAIYEKLSRSAKGKKTIDAMQQKMDYYFNPNTFEMRETEKSELSIRKQIAQICSEAGVLPGTYEQKEATNVVRKIQESVVSRLEQMIKCMEREAIHPLLLSALASEQYSIDVNLSGARLSKDLEDSESKKSLEKTTQQSENAKTQKVALLYLIETNLYLDKDRGEEKLDSNKSSEILSFAKWLIHLQNSSDLCFHTDSETKLIVLDDYRIDVELGENYYRTFREENRRRIMAAPFHLQSNDVDRDNFEKVASAFFEDTGVDFRVLESVLRQLSDCSFSSKDVEFGEIAPNVIKVKKSDAINDYFSFVEKEVPIENVKKAYDFLTLATDRLKSIDGKTHPILPIWEREKRDNCFSAKPLVLCKDSFIYSPIIVEELRKRWTSGLLQFYPPYEIGLDRTCTALSEWKSYYEHIFSSIVETLLKEAGCEYAKHDVDLRREDRNANHPSINILGDYDVIALSVSRKTIYVIECKVLQPIGSIFEHSHQQKRFFFKEKFDEKFQKRIDYFKLVAHSFFSNHGYNNTENFTIQPYMVVNKVFSSYYKHIDFPIVTFDELKESLNS